MKQISFSAKKITHHFLSIIALLIIGISSVFSQNISEKGFPLLKNFSYKEYESHPQNWAIAEDKRGILYIGNNFGVLEYDGESWRLIPIANKSNVRSLCVDKKGRIYVGADNEFGYLTPNAKGELEYSSISKNLPDSLASFGNVWNIHTSGDMTFFQCFKKIFVYTDSLHQVLESPTRFRAAYVVNENYYIHESGIGLSKYMFNRLVPLPFGTEFKNKEVCGIIKIENNKIIVATSNHGLYEYHVNVYGDEYGFKPFKTEIDAVFETEKILNLALLSDGNFSLGTRGKGIIVLDKNGEVNCVINKKTGLQDEIVAYQYVDSKNYLWAALSKGISKIDINDPISLFDVKSGLTGTVESIVRHKGKLYIGTLAGIYYLDVSKQNKKNPQLEDFQSDFKLVAPKECWNLISYRYNGEEILLAALNDGIFEVMDNNELLPIVENYPWIMRQWNIDSSVVFIGLDPGFSFIKRHKGKWIIGEEIEDIQFPIYTITQNGEGNIWLGSTVSSPVKINFNAPFLTDEFPEYQINFYDSSDGFPDEYSTPFYFQNKIFVGSDKAIYEYIPQSNNFIKNTELLNNKNENTLLFRAKADYSGNLWLMTIDENDHKKLIYISPNENTYQRHEHAFVNITNEILHAIYHDENGISWMGGIPGVYQFDPSMSKNFNRPLSNHIRLVLCNSDSVLFSGAFSQGDSISVEQSKLSIFNLHYKQNNISFEFASQVEGVQKSNVYSYMLEGFDKKFSNWQSENKAVYTNLAPGTYTFQVKAKNIYGTESAISTYQFSINPPWYQTFWYYTAQTVFLGLLVLISVLLNTSGKPSKFSSVIAFVTIITIFEFIILFIEPYVEDYADGVPLFKLAMNILLAISLNPIEHYLRKKLNERSLKKA